MMTCAMMNSLFLNPVHMNADSALDIQHHGHPTMSRVADIDLLSYTSFESTHQSWQKTRKPLFVRGFRFDLINETLAQRIILFRKTERNANLGHRIELTIDIKQYTV